MRSSIGIALVTLSGCAGIVDVDGYTFDIDPCGSPSASCEGGRELVFVVASGDIVRMDGDALDGFDLDATADPICEVEDFVSPTGEAGIDNQLTALGRLLEATSGMSIPEMVEAQILEGTTLTVVFVDYVDSLVDDDCVLVEQRRAYLPSGTTPDYLDADGDGDIDSGLMLDYTLPSLQDVNACIIDGVLHARYPDSVGSLPFGPPGNEFTSRHGRTRARIDETGLDGLAGGSTDVDELVSTLAMTTEPDPALVDLLRSYADLDPSSRETDDCSSISYALRYTAVPAVKGMPVR